MENGGARLLSDQLCTVPLRRSRKLRCSIRSELKLQRAVEQLARMGIDSLPNVDALCPANFLEPPFGPERRVVVVPASKDQRLMPPDRVRPFGSRQPPFGQFQARWFVRDPESTSCGACRAQEAGQPYVRFVTVQRTSLRIPFIVAHPAREPHDCERADKDRAAVQKVRRSPRRAPN